MTNQLRVGIVLSTRADIGGGSTYENAVLEEVRRLGNDETVFFTIRKHNGHYRLEADSSGPNFPTQPLRHGQLSSFFTRRKRQTESLSQVIEGLNLDLLYFASPVKALTEKTGVPYIATVWDLGLTELSHFPEFISAYGHEMFGQLARGLPRAFRVIVDSEATRAKLSRTFGLDPQRIIPAGLPLSNNLEILKPLFSLPEKYVVYPAKFWPHKNHKTIFKAFSGVVASVPDAHLVLTGIDQQDMTAVENMVENHGLKGSVVVLPRLAPAELNWIIKTANALVMPTLLGPTNYPPLEAMALGVKALISDVHLFDFELPESVKIISKLDSDAWSESLIEVFLRPSKAQAVRPGSSFGDTFLGVLNSFRSDWEIWNDSQGPPS